MLLYVFVVAFYCRMLFLRPANSSDTEGIPDLNFPASIEQADLTDHNAVDAGQNQPLVTLFTNRNHKGVAVPVTMRPVPEHLIGTGLFQNQKSVTVRGKRYFSDERRIQWQASKRKQRELQNDEVRRAIYRKEYHRKKEKVKAMEPHILEEYNARQEIKNKKKNARARAKRAALKAAGIQITPKKAKF